MYSAGGRGGNVNDGSGCRKSHKADWGRFNSGSTEERSRCVHRSKLSTFTDGRVGEKLTRHNTKYCAFDYGNVKSAKQEVA